MGTFLLREKRLSSHNPFCIENDLTTGGGGGGKTPPNTTTTTSWSSFLVCRQSAFERRRKHLRLYSTRLESERNASLGSREKAPAATDCRKRRRRRQQQQQQQQHRRRS